MKTTPSQFQEKALAGEYGYASQVSAEADEAIDAMTANEITLSKVIAIRGQVLIAAEKLDRIIDQIRHGEITPERATKEVFEEIIKIASVK